MISMAGKAIRRWWALFALPTFAAFIIGFLVPFIMGVPDVYLEVQHPCWSCNSNSSSANASAGVR